MSTRRGDTVVKDEKEKPGKIQERGREVAMPRADYSTLGPGTVYTCPQTGKVCMYEPGGVYMCEPVLVWDR